MSRKRNHNTEVMTEEQIEDIDVDVAEATEEAPEVVEKQPNKVLSVLKKVLPFAAISGAIAAAFVFGRSSGADSAYLAMLGEGDEGETEDEDDDETSETTEETEEE